MIGALGKGMLTIADGPEMPSVDDFLPDPFVFQGTPFAINRIILVRILATVIMLLYISVESGMRIWYSFPPWLGRELPRSQGFILFSKLKLMP